MIHQGLDPNFFPHFLLAQHKTTTLYL